MGASVTDIRDAAVFVQGVCHLAAATRTLIEQERRAFNLEEQQPVEAGPKIYDRSAGIAIVRAKFDEVLGRPPRYRLRLQDPSMNVGCNDPAS